MKRPMKAPVRPRPLSPAVAQMDSEEDGLGSKLRRAIKEICASYGIEAPDRVRWVMWIASQMRQFEASPETFAWTPDEVEAGMRRVHRAAAELDAALAALPTLRLLALRELLQGDEDPLPAPESPRPFFLDEAGVWQPAALPIDYAELWARKSTGQDVGDETPYSRPVTLLEDWQAQLRVVGYAVQYLIAKARDERGPKKPGGARPKAAHRARFVRLLSRVSEIDQGVHGDKERFKEFCRDLFSAADVGAADSALRAFYEDPTQKDKGILDV